MAIERALRNPVPVNFRPKNGRPYRVKNDESWTSIAKAASIDT
jgi:hypothetical protein